MYRAFVTTHIFCLIINRKCIFSWLFSILINFFCVLRLLDNLNAECNHSDLTCSILHWKVQMNHPVNANYVGLLYCVSHISHRILFFPFSHLLGDSVTVQQMCCYKGDSIYVSYSGKCNSKWLHGAVEQNILYSNQHKKTHLPLRNLYLRNHHSASNTKACSNSS